MAGVLLDLTGLVNPAVGVLDEMEVIDNDRHFRELLLDGRQEHRVHVDTDLLDPVFDLGRDSS